MLELNDPRWGDLKGGYRVPFDPRPWLAILERGTNAQSAWTELWENLHHQGDVGEVSYATVPHLVRIYRCLGLFDWNAYAIVAIIELARENPRNPKLPDWLEHGYFRAIQELSEIGVAQVSLANQQEDVRALLSIVAIAKGARIHGKFLLQYSDDELLEMESKL